MGWTTDGLLQPNDQGMCLAKCRRCLDICPFIDHAEGENTLAKTCFGQIPNIQRTLETGYYLSAYVGYSEGDYRRSGASGGMASLFLASLLR